MPINTLTIRETVVDIEDNKFGFYFIFIFISFPLQFIYLF